MDDTTNMLTTVSHVCLNSNAEDCAEPLQDHSEQVRKPHYDQRSNQGVMRLAKERISPNSETLDALISRKEDGEMNSSLHRDTLVEKDLDRPRNFWLPSPAKNPMLSPVVRDYLRAQRCVGSLGTPSFLGQKTANPVNFGQDYAERFTKPLHCLA